MARERRHEEEEYVIERVFGDGVIVVRCQTDVTVETRRRSSDVSVMRVGIGNREDQPGYPEQEVWCEHIETSTMR